MPDTKPGKIESESQRIKLTARLTLNAYDALTEIQRRHRRKTGKVLRLWEALDSAIIAYAKKLGIKVGE